MSLQVLVPSDHDLLLKRKPAVPTAGFSLEFPNSEFRVAWMIKWHLLSSLTQITGSNTHVQYCRSLACLHALQQVALWLSSIMAIHLKSLTTADLEAGGNLERSWVDFHELPDEIWEDYMKHHIFALLIGLGFTVPVVAEDIKKAELFAELPHSVGNITFTPDNRVIYSHHPFFSPDVRVAELNEDKASFTPFPNASWNTPRDGTDRYFDSVLGLRGDENGIVWILDMGQRNGLIPKLVGWNTWKNQLEKIYYIPAPASLPESQHNDFVVNNKDGVFVIADEGIGPGGDGSKAALVIVDMHTGATRRVLQGHVSTLPEDRAIVVDGKPLTVPDGKGGQVVIKVGADGIAADAKFEWLYFGPLNGSVIYRVLFSDLLDESLSSKDLESRVERYADKPNNGGLSIDQAGNLYLTEVETNAVGIIPTDTRKYRRYAVADGLSWPDGVSYALDGYMYVSAAQISRAGLFNNGEAKNAAPYLIYRFKPEAPGRIGH